MIEFSIILFFNRLLPFQPKIKSTDADSSPLDSSPPDSSPLDSSPSDSSRLKENRGTPKVLKNNGQPYEFTKTQIKKYLEVLEESKYVQELMRDLRFRPKNNNAVDFTAFWAFFFSYLLFNVVYWVYYSHA